MHLERFVLRRIRTKFAPYVVLHPISWTTKTYLTVIFGGFLVPGRFYPKRWSLASLCVDPCSKYSRLGSNPLGVALIADNYLHRHALALTSLMVKGVPEYSEDIVAQIDVPLLTGLEMTFFRQLIFDTQHQLSSTESVAHQSSRHTMKYHGMRSFPIGKFGSYFSGL